MAHVNTKHGKKITKKAQNKKYKNKNKMCIHQQFSIIATYRPPATTISFTPPPPRKEKTRQQQARNLP